MKKVLLLSTIIFCLIINACSDDNSASTSIEVLSEVSSSSISDDSSSSSISEDPLPGDTSALRYDCETIIQSLPIKPPSPYSLLSLETGLGQHAQCAVVFPEATDSMVRVNFQSAPFSLTALNYLNDLSVYDDDDDSSILTFHANIEVYFIPDHDHFNQLNIEFIQDCRKIAHVYNIPEKDSLWTTAGGRCALKSEVPIAPEEIENKKQALIADGWVYEGCMTDWKFPNQELCDFHKKLKYSLSARYVFYYNGALRVAFYYK